MGRDEDMKALAKEVAGRIRSYRGPLDLRWIAADAHLLASISGRSSGVLPGVADALLHNLYHYVEQAPKSGIAVYATYLLETILRSLFRPCRTNLMLLPGYQGNNFHASMVYWQAFANPPVAWNQNTHCLSVVGDPELLEFPVFCMLQYPSYETSSSLVWPGCFHEVGHYVWDSLAFPAPGEGEIDRFWNDHADLCDIDFQAHSQAEPSLIVSNWLAELFCDALATLLIGPAYPLALKHYASHSPDFDPYHPPLSLRVEFLRPLVDEVLKPIRSSAFSRDVESELAPAAVPAGRSNPFVEHVAAHTEQWRGSCTSLARKLVERAECSLWPTDTEDASSELAELVGLLLAWVPPVGALSLDQADARRATLSVEVARPGVVFLAAQMVRYHAKRWAEFTKPWTDETRDPREAAAKGGAALESLLAKALIDGYVHGRLRRGSERQEDTGTSCPIQ